MELGKIYESVVNDIKNMSDEDFQKNIDEARKICGENGELYDIELAKKIASDMGIPWDNNATSTTLNGKPIKDGDIGKIFESIN